MEPTLSKGGVSMEIIFRPCSTWEPAFVAAIQAHYTKSRGAPPGKKLAWEILEAAPGEFAQHRGWIGLGEPTFKLAVRRRLGLMDGRPLPGTVNNFIYRLDAKKREGETLASDILILWHEVASLAWFERYKMIPIHWETMVDPAEVVGDRNINAGCCFRNAGYRSLGMTTGRGARRPAGATHAARVWGDVSPKLVFYRGPLHRLPKVKHAL
jgi:hypothetical protein